MVVGVFETYDTRKIFEYDFADRLKSCGVEAIPSYHVSPPPGREMRKKEIPISEKRVPYGQWKKMHGEHGGKQAGQHKGNKHYDD